MAFDDRSGQHRIWASTSSYWGTLLRSSDDFGKSWTNPPQAPIRFPSDTGVSLKNIWQIALGRPEQPNVLYCGVEPAALFETSDAGETWSLVRGLFDHPHRPRWMPGNGGLALHTIVLDPADSQRMYVAVSSGGVYRTSDGGCTWTAQNRGIRAMLMPDKYPEFGQCVHKIAMHPDRPERLFLQNHWGLYRSDDCAENWIDIANGVPSDFGFAVLIHPEILTACISFQLSPMSFAVRATAGCEFIEPATLAPPGSLSCAGCPKSVLTKRSCVMP
jgi:hypothetical protein